MESFKKPPLSFAEQTNLLASRGLIINDRATAEKYLSYINYYRLSAYVLSFETCRHEFKPGVTFDCVKSLYEFDRNLRFLLDESLEIIEIALRTMVSYFLANKYGAFAHEDPHNFFRKFAHEEWIYKIHEETRRSRETFINHYKTKYLGFPKLPIWMAVEVMSFGALSQLVKNLVHEDQISIAQKLSLHSKILISWLHTFSYIRNMCAHHSRLWNRDLAIAMELPKNHEWDKLNEKKIGTALIAINQFLLRLPIELSITRKWKQSIENLLEEGPTDPDIFREMGIPKNFKEDILWK